MPRQAATKEYNTFIKGIVTEANALTFPENASVDESNFVLNRDGSRQRRLGVDYENDYGLSSSIDEENFDEGVVTTHMWNSILGNTSSNLVMIQIGDTLHFYDADNPSVSANKLTDTIDLNDFVISGASLIHTYPVQAATVRGYLVVTGEIFEPFYVAYTKDTGALRAAKITPEIRDFTGLNDGLLVDENPSSLSDRHSYNLYNQGWDNAQITAYQTATSLYPSNTQVWVAGKDTTDDFDATLLDKQYFGNSPAPKGHYTLEVFDRTYYTQKHLTSSLGVTAWGWDVTEYEVEVTTSSVHGLTVGDTVKLGGAYHTYVDYEDNYRTKVMEDTINNKAFRVTAVLSTTKFRFANTANIKAGDVSGLQGGTVKVTKSVTSTAPIVIETEASRFSAVGSFAGRAFYSGLKDSLYSNYVFFSRILNTENDLGKCYQEADPTSEEMSDLVATDGGYIVIPEANKIVKLLPLRQVLLVFAENGVWQIAGDPDTGFSATNYNVTKISSVGTEYVESIVPVEGSCVYWSIGGIYAMQPDQVSGNLNAVNISQDTVQTLYLSIPGISKLYAKGIYDQTTKRISWLYNDSDAYDGTSYRNQYTQELVFDTVLGAFYKNDISSLAVDSPYVGGYIQTPDIQSTNLTVSVVVGGVAVEASGNPVQHTSPTLGRGLYQFKFLTVVPQTVGSKITFSAYINPTFMDWVSADSTGVDYTSYLITGYEIYGDTQRSKQVKYLTTHFKRTETDFVADGTGLSADNASSCFVQSQWQWADSANSGRWGTAMQAYRLKRMYIPVVVGDTHDYGFDVVTTKNKIRGHGTALSLYFYSENGKDAHILGWGVDAHMGTIT